MQAHAARRTIRYRLARAMRKRGWNYRTPSNGLRHRIHDLMDDPHPWWDWGHRLMIVVGHDWCGSWSEPTPPTWWYRRIPGRPMLRTGYPRSRFQIVTDYDEFRSLTEGLNEDQLYEWQAINANQDGELHLGHRYWGGAFYAMPRDEWPILRRWLRKARRLDWWGARTWLYKQALNAAVNIKRPFRCHVVPPKGSGGYSHWFCNEKRGHPGPHRFNNYEWDEAKPRVEYAPTDRAGGPE